MVRDLDRLIRDFELAVDNDLPSPELTDLEKRALAIRYIAIETERQAIKPRSILGLTLGYTEVQWNQRYQLSQQLGPIRNFLIESLMVANQEMIDYVVRVGGDQAERLLKPKPSARQRFSTFFR